MPSPAAPAPTFFKNCRVPHPYPHPHPSPETHPCFIGLDTSQQNGRAELKHQQSLNYVHALLIWGEPSLTAVSAVYTMNCIPSSILDMKSFVWASIICLNSKLFYAESYWLCMFRSSSTSFQSLELAWSVLHIFPGELLHHSVPLIFSQWQGSCYPSVHLNLLSSFCCDVWDLSLIWESPSDWLYCMSYILFPYVCWLVALLWNTWESIQKKRASFQ